MSGRHNSPPRTYVAPPHDDSYATCGECYGQPLQYLVENAGTICPRCGGTGSIAVNTSLGEWDEDTAFRETSDRQEHGTHRVVRGRIA